MVEEQMRIRIAVEDIEPNHWIAWAFDLPACYSSARISATLWDTGM
jgi:hypothetical protein